MHKFLFLIIATLGFNTLGQAEQAHVPSKFQGFKEELNICKIALEIGTPNIGAIISATEIHGYEEYCEVKR